MKLKNIFAIYRSDLSKSRKNWVSLVILLGLMILPSLYAWINIRASWDPYNNTNGLQVAIVNEDKGSTITELGLNDSINLGKDVTEGLRDNDKLGWIFDLPEDQAMTMLENGEIYSVIIIPEDFSQNMASILSTNVKKPALEYYINEKMNPIASKITESGANAIQKEIRDEFEKQMAEKIFAFSQDLGIELDNNYDKIQKYKVLILELNDRLPDIGKDLDSSIDQIEKSMDYAGKKATDLKNMQLLLDNVSQLSKMSSQDMKKAQKSIDMNSPQIQQNIADARVMFEDIALVSHDLKKSIAANKPELISRIDATQSDIASALKRNDEIAKKAGSFADSAPTEIQGQIQDISSDLQRLQTKLNGISNLVNSSNNTDFGRSLSTAEQQVQSLMDKLTALENSVENFFTNGPGALLPNGEVTANILLEKINSQITHLQSIQNNLRFVEMTGNGASSSIQGDIAHLEQTIQKVQQLSQGAGEGMISGIAQLDKSTQNVSDRLDNKLVDLSQQLDKLKNNLENKEMAEQILGDMEQTSYGIKASLDILGDKLNDESFYRMKEYLDKFIQINNNAADSLENLNEDIDFLSGQLSYISSKKDITVGDLQRLKQDFPELEANVGKMADKIREMDDKMDFNALISEMVSDNNRRVDFIVNPVELEKHPIFELENYGAGMTPFYSVLCLWVGCMLMTALLTTKAKNVEFEYTPLEEYFGKYLFFVTIGVVQALIVSLGDIYLLKVTMQEPALLVWLSVFISIVFVTIVYTLVALFGNVGKAIGVILLVLQVAASGGTFPIQVTPPFFQKIHGLIPFTYAIGAMREAVAGVTYNVLHYDLRVLIIFFVVFMVIGVLLKRLANKYLEAFQHKLKESGIVEH